MTQDAPESTKAGKSILIKLEIATFGHGYSQNKRLSDLSLEYRSVGENHFKRAEPLLLSRSRPKASLPNYELGKFQFIVPSNDSAMGSVLE